jgi:hypothetical protein
MDTAQVLNMPEAERRARLTELLRGTPPNAGAAPASPSPSTAQGAAQPQMVPTAAQP